MHKPKRMCNENEAKRRGRFVNIMKLYVDRNLTLNKKRSDRTISIPKTKRLSDFLATFATPCAPPSFQAILHKEIKRRKAVAALLAGGKAIAKDKRS